MTKPKPKPWRFLSGFCNPSFPLDDPSHGRCPGSYKGNPCVCDCHVDPVLAKVELRVVDKAEPQPGGEVVTIAQGGPATMSAEDYHAHPALSSTGARKLLAPSCPAIYRYERDNPPPPKDEFDFGHAAHTLALGAGPDIVPLDFDSRRTNAFKAADEEARAEGKVPLLRKDFDRVQAMVTQLREHPVVAKLLDPEFGAPEQSLFWTDADTEVPCRARLDWLSKPRPSGRVVAWDYKTTTSVAPDKISKAIDDFGYHQQGPWYLDGMRALDLAGDDAVFLFVFQQREPPFLVTVAQLNHLAMQIGAALNHQAREVFRRCVETDHWPAYADEPIVVSLPTYSENRYLQELAL